jgi:predicted nucleotidyltransferase
MINGLSKEENDFIYSSLIDTLKNAGCKIFIFGSRATQKHKKFSDIDLLYVKTELNDSDIEKTIFRLVNKIEESRFPYKIDLVDNSNLASSFRSKIELEKIEL